MKRIFGLHAVALCASMVGFGLPARAAGPVPPGTVSVEVTPGGSEFGAPLRAFVDAVSDALASRGFTTLDDPGHAALVAELVLSRTQVGTVPARVKADRSTVTPGDVVTRVGAGVVIPLPTGKSTLTPLERTNLQIRIRRRDEAAILWQGSALTVRAARTKNGEVNVIAAELAQALLRDYPAEPAGIISVP